jgi:SH3-like domain-containing protein
VGTPRPAPTAPKSTPVPLGGAQRRVANTDGQGVALRDTPGGARLPAKGYDEGTVVMVLEQQGAWTHIRGQDGREGWVLSVTLAP